MGPGRQSHGPKFWLKLFLQTRRLQESFEGSNSSLAYFSGELSRVIASYSSRQWETHAFSDVGGKMLFWPITLVADMLKACQGLYRRGRSSSFQKKFEPKFWPIGLAFRARQSWSNIQKQPQVASPSQANPSPKLKIFFLNRTKRSSRICRGFERLSSYCGWRVITKKTRANILALVGVKGLLKNIGKNASASL